MQFQREAYFEWLYNKAFATRDYYDLMKVLFTIKFVWYVPFDRNRAMDGIGLRRSYLFEHGRSGEHYDFDPADCTFFELFVGLAETMGRLLDRSVPASMLNLLKNTPFFPMKNGRFTTDEAWAVASVIIDREYDADGDLGFFPLSDPPRDQREVELLSQMNSYITENGW